MAFPLATRLDVHAPISEALAVPEELQLGQYIPLHYHFNMLQDADRVGAFQAAITQVVERGMEVVELGAGTGILSSFAAQRGARVTCVERNPALAATAEKLLAANGLAGNTSVYLGDASHYIPTEPVDVVICEMLHVAMLREKQLQVIDAFKRNYRRRFGPSAAYPRFIPEASILMWQPIYQMFDFAGYWAPIPMFQPPLLVSERTTEVASLDPYASIDYQADYSLHFDCRQTLCAAQEGSINAIRFVTQNVLVVDVAQQNAITWPNQFLVLPLPEAVAVRQGQQLEVSFCYDSGAPLEQLSESLQLLVK